MVQQIGTDEYHHYFGSHIRAHCDALRHLCRVGIMVPCDGYDVDLDDRVFAAKFAHEDMML